MNTQMMICLLLFVFMLVSFLMAKIPLGVTASIVAILLAVTHCVAAEDVLGSFGNSNTIIIASMIVLASGLGRTTVPGKITDVIRRVTNGNYKLAYLGVLLIGLVLTSMIASPMAAYAIVFPIMDVVCDEFGVSRSKAQFPLLVVCLGCCAIFPLGASISQAAVFDGFMQNYGFTQSFSAMDFFKGRWPAIILIFLWAYFIAPKVTIDQPVLPISDAETTGSAKRKLSKFADISGVIIFFVTILGFIFGKKFGISAWLVSFAGVILMVVTGTLTKKEAIAAIPVDICLLFVGANTMAKALVSTGTADAVGNVISNTVGNHVNTVVLYIIFFIVPFILTQIMQNQSVMNVFAPIALLTCSALGADPRGCLILIAAGSLTAFMTPAATAAVAMAMSAGGYDVKALFKMSAIIAVALMVVYVGYVSMVYPAF